ncbi:MAG: hypothetical protein DPW18_17710 [Chloroflexi bacterium]|nr:hypothetical protein [Chloroflexota bacterium]MDL1944513.1 formylglycine-generating enzyme family protein [Chloroflexi bacterium CFX2]
MRRIQSFTWAAIIAIMLVSGCNLGATPPPAATDEPPPSPTAEPPTATAETVPTEAVTTTPVTIDIAGPPMQVGSRYTYVDGTVLVAVPGGPFTMGYNFADNPVREVTVGDFWIYSTKVTNSQYALCVQLGECTPPDKEKNPSYGDARYIKYPVTGVTHAQAVDYCTFVHGRLPTEAEWEKTARGPDGNIFPWGDEAPNCTLLNYKFCVGRTTWVNEYKSGVSYYGAFDMSGNAREWAADWYSPTYNIENPIPDPLGPDFGEKRSVRGSSYQDSANPTIAAHRFSLDPLESLPDLGFRCVIEDPTYFAPWCEQSVYVGTGADGSQPNCQPAVKCNDVSIKQSPNCTPNYSPYTIVTFNVSNTPPNDYTYSLDGCFPDPDGDGSVNKFLCYPDGAGTAVTTGSCTYEAPAGCKVCPEHYTLNGDVCVWDGSSTSGRACLPGSTFNPLTNCCTAIPGSGTDVTICPAGTYPLNGACIDNPKGVVDTDTQTVIFDKCAPPVTVTPKTPGGGDDDGGDGSCTEPADGCRKVTGGQAPYWNPATCSCQSTPP